MFYLVVVVAVYAIETAIEPAHFTMASPSDAIVCPSTATDIIPRSVNRKSKRLLLQVTVVFVFGVVATFCQLHSSSQTLFASLTPLLTDAPVLENNSNAVSVQESDNITVKAIQDEDGLSSNGSHQDDTATKNATPIPSERIRNPVVGDNNRIVPFNVTLSSQQNMNKIRIQNHKRRRQINRSNNNNNRKQRLIPQGRESLNISNLTEAQIQQLAHSLRERKPIFAAGLPKTGTTSLHKYFLSVKIKGVFQSSHTYTKLHNGTSIRAGACMQQQFLQKKPMLRTCGRFQVWSDSGYALRGDCFYPLWHALDLFVQQYPYATIILNTRNATDWTNSIHTWSKGSLAKRWMKCRNGLSPTLPRTLKKKEWIHFYHVYHERIRQACQQHSTLKCIEFDIGDANAGAILEREFGIPALHWRNCDPRDWSCKSHATNRV